MMAKRGTVTNEDLAGQMAHFEEQTRRELNEVKEKLGQIRATGVTWNAVCEGKATIEEYLAAVGVEPIEDPSELHDPDLWKDDDDFEAFLKAMRAW